MDRSLHIDVFESAPGLTLRYGFAPCAGIPRASVLLLEGRSEFIEKYAEVIDELRSRAFDVWILDWRGQGLSARELDNPHKGYIEDFDHYLADLDAFCRLHVLATKRAASRPLVMLAHSMGGHIGLRYLYQHGSRFAAAVMTAPMLGIALPLPEPAARLLFEAGVALGFGDHHIGGDYGAFQRTFENNPWTRDRARFEIWVQAVEQLPGVALGGPTLHWLRAAMRSIAKLRRPSVARSISTPSLLIAAGDDRVVSREPIERFAEHLPHGEYLVVPGSEHEVLVERDHLRAIFWNAFDAFVEPRI